MSKNIGSNETGSQLLFKKLRAFLFFLSPLDGICQLNKIIGHNNKVPSLRENL